MKDNISIIVLTIIAVLLLVILPLVSVLERQDNMSYNLVMKLTTSFVDEVRNKGYIDSDSYNKFIQSLSVTGNSYDIQMEAHKKIIIKADGFTEANPVFKESTLIDYNMDILTIIKDGDIKHKDTNNKSQVYLFEKGDEFYVKIKNTNITGATILYNYLSNSSKKDIINISYGGIINKKSWDKYLDHIEFFDGNPEILISLPKNLNNMTPVKIIAVGFGAPINTFENYFDLSEASDKKLTFTIKILRAMSLNIVHPNQLSTYIELEGFNATQTVEKKSEFEYKITLTNISILSDSSDCKINVKENLANGDYSNSLLTEGDDFTIYNDLNLHWVRIDGPFLGPFNGIDHVQCNIVGGRIKVPTEDDVYFIVNYSAIKKEPTEADIRNRLEYITGFNNTLAASSIITDIKYDVHTKKGQAQINLNIYTPFYVLETFDNYLLLKEGSTERLTDADGSPTANAAISNYFDIKPKNIWNFAYTETMQSWEAKKPGRYKFQLWGAQGGNGYGGGGGYAEGIIEVTTPGQKFSIYVGGTKPVDYLGGDTGSVHGALKCRIQWWRMCCRKYSIFCCCTIFPFCGDPNSRY